MENTQENKELTLIETLKTANVYPLINHYNDFLQKAINKFGITLNEARTKYGLFTYNQWNELLK